MGKLFFWATIGFAVYAGVAWAPAYMKLSQLEGAVARVLEHGDHTMRDEVLRLRAVQAARSSGLELEEGLVDVVREERPGERTIHVRFDVELPVSFLGERVLARRLDVARGFPVDEAIEARRLRDEAEKGRRVADQRRRANEYQDDYKRRVREECAKGTGDVVVESVMITYGNGRMDVVGCDQVRQWR